MFDLQSWLSYLEQCHPKEIDMGLERVKKVGFIANLLNFACPVVMVGGTNGKGSTVACLSHLLRSSGLKVGTYTSPHLLNFNERIQINGQCVSATQICEAFERVEIARNQTPLTFFEFTTLAAFSIFQGYEETLDIMVLEIGMGGRLDAVNIIDPDLVILTSIGYDHQEFLGSTLQSIAFEKAGILRPQIPVILGSKANIGVINAQIVINQNKLWVEGLDFDFTNITDCDWCLKKEEVINLPDFYLPRSSVSLALAAYTVLGECLISLPPLRTVVKSLANIMMVGRFQQMMIAQKRIIFDVGHNPDASVWLAKKLTTEKKHHKIFTVWASLRDKALANIVEPLKEIVEAWYIGDLGVKRAASSEVLQRALTTHGIQKIVDAGTIPHAFDAALAQAEDGDDIVVFGSFYTVSQVLSILFANKQLENNGLFSHNHSTLASN